MKRFWLLILSCMLILFGSAMTVTVSHAAVDTPGGEFTEGLFDTMEFAENVGISTNDNIFAAIGNVIKFLLALSAMLAMGAIVWGGIMYITSLGDEGKAEKAKGVIKYAIIGVIVVLISYVIVAFIQNQLVTLNPFTVDVAHAQVTDTSKGFDSGIQAINTHINPATSGLATDTDLVPVILKIVNYMLGLVAVLALAAMVWGSLMYILSLGDENRTEKAKRIILYAIIGVLLAGASFVILSALEGLLTGP